MLNAIKNIVLEYAEVEESEINENTSIVSDLNLNSYDFVSIIGRLEEEFGVEIPDRDIQEFETLGDVDKYLREKMN